MYKQGYKLMHPVDFDNAMYFGSQIIVKHSGEIIDQGVILNHQNDTLRFRHNLYSKSDYEFLVVFTPPNFPRS